MLIIVASIIMNFTASKSKDTSDSSANQSTVVIKEGTQDSRTARPHSSYGNATNPETETVVGRTSHLFVICRQQRVAIRLPLSSAATADTTSGTGLLVAQQLMTPLN